MDGNGCAIPDRPVHLPIGRENAILPAGQNLQLYIGFWWQNQRTIRDEMGRNRSDDRTLHLRVQQLFFLMIRRPPRSTLFPYKSLSDLGERTVKAAELFAFTLRVRAGNTDVLTDAEERK